MYGTETMSLYFIMCTEYQKVFRIKFLYLNEVCIMYHAPSFVPAIIRINTEVEFEPYKKL